MDKRNLERAIRASGRDIAAAALAGCPEESVDLARPLFARIGAAALEDDAAHLRSRLSGDEIAQAQAAFLEVVRSLEERGELRLGLGGRALRGPRLRRGAHQSRARPRREPPQGRLPRRGGIPRRHRDAGHGARGPRSHPGDTLEKGHQPHSRRHRRLGPPAQARGSRRRQGAGHEALRGRRRREIAEVGLGAAGRRSRLGG